MSAPDVQTQRKNEWKSRLTDIDGRIARQVLLRIQDQAHKDASYYEKQIAVRKSSLFWPTIFTCILCLIQTITLLIFLVVVGLNVLSYSSICLIGILILANAILSVSIIWRNLKFLSVAFGQNFDRKASSVIGQIAKQNVNKTPGNSLDMLQYELQCCGFDHGLKDYSRHILYHWIEPFSNKSVVLENDYEFVNYCRGNDSTLCRAPNSCCADFAPKNEYSKEALSCVRTFLPWISSTDVRRKVALQRAFKFGPKENSALSHPGCVAKFASAIQLWSYISMIGFVFCFLIFLSIACLLTLTIAEVDGLGSTNRISPLLHLSVFGTFDKAHDVSEDLEIKGGYPEVRLVQRDEDVIAKIRRGKRAKELRQAHDSMSLLSDMEMFWPTKRRRPLNEFTVDK
ncbi:hypothetical protein M3Y98_01065900 [Aphelenchoides besseyi]|nr:hypothetical protein M3Y98_01065900 [Aphelenchoides besseyi]